MPRPIDPNAAIDELRRQHPLLPDASVPTADAAFSLMAADGSIIIDPEKVKAGDATHLAALRVLLGVDAAETKKKYVALLSQSGTDAPVATELENTLGGTVVWSRQATGVYIGTLVGAFPIKSTCFVSAQTNSYLLFGVCNFPDELLVYTTDLTGAPIDGYLSRASIAVTVYP